MDKYDEVMLANKDNKCYCSCAAKERRMACPCGEVESELAWRWDENFKTPSAIVLQNCQKVYFHKGYSVGNACVRGDTPFVANNDYYWEIKMLSSVYGTSMMVGVGTENFNIHQLNEEFSNLIGCDGESWGMRFDGTLFHNCRFHNYNPLAGFTIGSIIGVHLDMWSGTLEFYLNRIPLGIAFTGLKNKILYPLVSSTASHTVMNLIFAHSEPHSLLLMSLKNLTEKCLGNLPPGLKSYSKTCWWFFPKSNKAKQEKKVDMLPSLYNFDVLTDSDDEDSDGDYNSINHSVLAHRVKRVLDNSAYILNFEGSERNYFNYHPPTTFRPYKFRNRFRGRMEF